MSACYWHHGHGSEARTDSELAELLPHARSAATRKASVGAGAGSMLVQMRFGPAHVGARALNSATGAGDIASRRCVTSADVWVGGFWVGGVQSGTRCAVAGRGSLSDPFPICMDMQFPVPLYGPNGGV